jgi:hypothetical protein
MSSKAPNGMGQYHAMGRVGFLNIPWDFSHEKKLILL